MGIAPLERASKIQRDPWPLQVLQWEIFFTMLIFAAIIFFSLSHNQLVIFEHLILTRQPSGLTNSDCGMHRNAARAVRLALSPREEPCIHAVWKTHTLTIRW